MGISFANPALAWGALAAAIPVLVHLLQRRRPRPVPFAAIELVRRSQQRNVRRLRLRRLLLLAARTTILLCVPLALARPHFTTGEHAAAAPRGPAATAIVLDASLSMTWKDGRRSLFDRARDDAREALASLGPDEPVTVVICDGTTPRPEAPSFDRAAVRRLLDAAEPSFRKADLGACATAAAHALGESPVAGKRLVVATDLTAAAWNLDAPPPAVPTESGDVRPEATILDASRGEPLPNVAIVDLAVGPAPEIGARAQAFTVTLRNFGDAPLKDAPLELWLGEEITAKGFVDVEAHGTATKRLVHRFSKGGTFTGRVRLAADALAADDERAFAIQVPRDLRALVVDGSPSSLRYRDEAFFVDTALRVAGATPVTATTVDTETLADQDLSHYDLLLLLNVRAPSKEVAARIERFVEGGGGLFVSVGDQVDADEYGAVLGGLLPRPLHLVKTAAEPDREDQRPARFVDLDLDHPILGIFSKGAEGFEAARTWRYFLLQPGSTGRVLASFDDGAPALVEGARGAGRVLLYTSTVDRDWSDWPIQTSFLPTMQQAAAYLSRTLEDRRQRAALVGDAFELDEPDGLTVTGPDGRERAIEDGRVVDLDRPGLFAVTAAEGGAERSFAVTLDPAESDTRKVDAREVASWLGGERGQVESAPGGRSQGESPLWSVLAALAVMAFAAEGVLVRKP
ncbi:MAG TPA: BatA domain-containing protein [Vulgatibacter sp.]|nr:BatA domain-containing protein [Vulgatibacter sp.]